MTSRSKPVPVPVPGHAHAPAAVSPAAANAAPPRAVPQATTRSRPSAAPAAPSAPARAHVGIGEGPGGGSGGGGIARRPLAPRGTPRVIRDPLVVEREAEERAGATGLYAADADLDEVEDEDLTDTDLDGVRYDDEDDDDEDDDEDDEDDDDEDGARYEDIEHDDDDEQGEDFDATASAEELTAGAYKRLDRVDLPTGGFVRVRKFGLTSAVRAGLLPDALLDVADKLLGGGLAEARGAARPQAASVKMPPKPGPGANRAERRAYEAAVQRAQARGQEAQAAASEPSLREMISLMDWLVCKTVASFKVVDKPPEKCAADEVSIYEMDEGDKQAIGQKALGGQVALRSFRR